MIKTEIRCRRSEVRGQRSGKDRSQRSEKKNAGMLGLRD